MFFEKSDSEVFPEMPLWTFKIKEVSAGVYEIRGRDMDGRSVGTTGTNVQEMVEQLKKDAARISKDVPVR